MCLRISVERGKNVDVSADFLVKLIKIKLSVSVIKDGFICSEGKQGLIGECAASDICVSRLIFSKEHWTYGVYSYVCRMWKKYLRKKAAGLIQHLCSMTFQCNYEILFFHSNPSKFHLLSKRNSKVFVRMHGVYMDLVGTSRKPKLLRSFWPCICCLWTINFIGCRWRKQNDLKKRSVA